MTKHGRMLWSAGTGLVAAILAPVVLVIAGKPAPRGLPALRRRRIHHRMPPGAGHRIDAFTRHRARHPLVIALATLGRRTRRALRRLVGRRGAWWRWYPGAPPFFGGVREPRRPSPTLPTDMVALKVPAQADDAI